MSAPAAARRLGQREFLALMAMLFATIAFSTDAMLPALPQIASELTPGAANRAQLIVTSFLLGMGAGTLFTGPLSDAFGRKRVVLAFAAVYIAGGIAAWAAPTLEVLLAARLLQGLGAAGPRVIALAIVRDLYKGREMARLVSFVFLIFSLFPAVAPLLGKGIIAFGGWRTIFLMLIVFITTSTLWLGLRQPETLPPERRIPFRPRALMAAVRTVLANRVVRFTIAVQVFIFAQHFTIISTTQPVFDQVFGRAESFPVWFALIALCAGASSFLNARLVMRLGMRLMVVGALTTALAVSALTVAAGFLPGLSDGAHFAIYMFWVITIFFQLGLTAGNLNALALEPMGALAGTATSVIGALSTAFSVLVAAPIGQLFNGTTTPIVAGCFTCGVIALLLMLRMGGREDG